MDLTSKELSNQYICDNHFVSPDYTNKNKFILNTNAVPIQYEDIEHLLVTTPTNVYEKVCVKSPIQSKMISKSSSSCVCVQTLNKNPSFTCNSSIVALTASTSTLTPKTTEFIKEAYVPIKLQPKQLFNGDKIFKLENALKKKKNKSAVKMFFYLD